MTCSRLVSRRLALKVSAGGAILSLLAGSPAFAQQSPPDSPKAKELQAMVDKAATLVDSKGKAAFSELGKPDSEWRHGDTYFWANRSSFPAVAEMAPARSRMAGLISLWVASWV